MTPCSDGLIRTYAGVVWRLVRTCRIPLLTSLPGPVPSGSGSGAHKYLCEPRRSTQTKEERGAMHAAAAAVETAVGSQRVRPCAKMFHVKHDRHNTQAELRQGLPKWSHPGSNRLVPDLMELPWASGIGHGTPDQGTRPRNLDPEPRKGPSGRQTRPMHVGVPSNVHVAFATATILATIERSAAVTGHAGAPSTM